MSSAETLPGWSGPATGTTDTAWFPVEQPCVVRAREHVRGVLRGWGVDPTTVDDALLLVSELATNVVEHTHARSFGVDVVAGRSRVVIGIRESGESSLPTPDTHMLADFSEVARPGPRDVHGRGLHILDALAAEWGISRQHRATSTWFTLAPDQPLPLQVVDPAAAAELDAAQAGLRRTRLLLRITEHLGTAVTPGEVGAALARHLQEELEAVFVGIALVVPEDDGVPRRLHYLDLSDLPDVTRREWDTVDLDLDAPVAAAARTRTALFHASPEAAEAEFPGIAEHMRAAGTGAMAHLPLLADGTCSGTLALAWSEPREIDADTRALLTIVAGYAAQALHRRDPR